MLNNSIQYTLRYAMIAGEKDEVKSILQNGANPNFCDEVGDTPLHYAIQLNNKEIFKLLVQNGADLNIKNAQNKTALDLLKDARWDEDPEVQSLLVNVKDTEGRTALHYAAFNGNVDIVKSLLARGADVNARDNNKTTPLHSARSKAVAEILVNNGADIHAVNKNGNTPFLSALHFANESVVSYDNDKSSVCKELLEFLIKCSPNVPEKFTSLLKSIGIDAIAKEEISPITKFVMENKDNFNSNTIEKIKDLLAKGYDINARDSNGYTPLYYAWSDKNNSNNMLLKFLVEQGADPKIQKYYNSSAGTLLAYAARAGDKEFVELLLKKGANIINSGAKNGLGLMVGAYLKFVSKQSIFESLKKYNSHIDDAIKIEVIKTYLGEEYVDCYNNTNTFNTGTTNLLRMTLI